MTKTTFNLEYVVYAIYSKINLHDALNKYDLEYYYKRDNKISFNHSENSNIYIFDLSFTNINNFRIVLSKNEDKTFIEFLDYGYNHNKVISVEIKELSDINVFFDKLIKLDTFNLLNFLNEKIEQLYVKVCENLR